MACGAEKESSVVTALCLKRRVIGRGLGGGQESVSVWCVPLWDQRNIIPRHDDSGSEEVCKSEGSMIKKFFISTCARRSVRFSHLFTFSVNGVLVNI